MKIKELKRTVNVSWSPAEHYPSMLAAGSAAQQVDASFSSNSYLELYFLNLEDPSFDFEVKSSIPTQHKFQKLVWSGAGVIAGGCDGGLLEFYSADKLLNNASDALVSSSSKHNGHVSALDVNPYQKNLLASGASDSEIFIWDLNNTSQPMAPGNRSQPYDHVQGLAWNQQVQHILGSTFATRCLVWDLRKNEPIMKLSDSQSRTRWRALAWHPSVATQLCIASEDDQAPVIQLWDLRLAASPLATLEGHNSGVLSLSWSRHDDDLLLSAGKDGRLLAWNPNNTRPGGEIVSEVSRQSAWILEVSWSPREAGLLAAAGFDHSLTVHSLLPSGTSKPATTSNILDSFDGVEGLGSLPALQPAPVVAHSQPTRAPKWLRKPVGGRFAFGGKLVTFEKCSQEAGSQKLVHISQVVSEPDIVEKASELDNVIALTQSREPGAAEKLAEYCRAKGDASSDQHERYIWFFLRSSFLPSFREDVLNMLGFKQDDVPSKFKGQSTERAPDAVGLSRGESTETEAELSTDTSTDLSDAQTLIERKMANVELDSFAANIVIPNGDDNNSSICRALVTGNFEEAVDLCIEGGRVADALVIASLGGPELVQKAQNHHFQSTRSEPVSLVAGAIARASWGALVRGAAPACWPRTLAALLRHAGEPPHAYCDMLGDKLSEESDPQLQQAASLCYVCAANADALAVRALHANASAAASADSAAADASAAATAKLAALAKGVELALLVRSAAAVRGLSVQQQNSQVDALLTQYASRLAAQGCLRSALSVLQGSATDLASRLGRALGEPQTSGHAGYRHPHQQQHHHHHQQQHSQQHQHVQHSSRSRTVSSHSQRQYGGQSDNSYNAAPAQEVPNWSAAPPRPPSVASQSGGITSRSKYKVDPSVQSAPSYNQYSFNNPIQNQPSYGYNSPYPDQYNASSVPSHNFAPINQPNPINPLNPVPLNPLNPVPLNPVPLNPLAPAPLNPVNQINPAVNGNYYGQEATPAVKPAAPGWNDPPMMTTKPKPKPEVQQQAPITHPLFGVEPPQHVPLVPTQYPGQNQFPGQNQYPGQQNQYPGQQNQYPGQIGQPAQFPGQQNQYPGQLGQFPGQQGQFPGQQGQFPGQQGQYPGQYQEQYPGQYPPGQQPGYPQQVESPAPVEAPAPIQKGPIPEQHAILQTMFDDLRNACSERAVNVQMKRKLEDVQRKLETLYDMLRENRLSETALSSLHSCVQCAQAGDHESALQVVTSLATGPDFSAVASFLPGLKILFLLAAQLQVRS